MWVLVKKSYAGAFGIYPGGQKHDLDEKTVIGLRKKLGKENVVGTCAPEDEQKDETIDLKAHANEAINKARELRERAEQYSAKELQLAKEHTAAGELCTKSEHKINMALQDNTVDLHGLSVEQIKNVAVLYIAKGRLQIANGESILATMEAENAEKNAAELAKQAGIDWPKKV